MRFHKDIYVKNVKKPIISETTLARSSLLQTQIRYPDFPGCTSGGGSGNSTQAFKIVYNVGVVLEVLNQMYGAFSLVGDSKSSLTYRAGERIIKIYKQPEQAYTELKNVQRVGLYDALIDTALCIANKEILVMHRFDGSPVSATTLPEALPTIRQFLQHLHRPTSQHVNTAIVAEKLKRFETIKTPELEPLFAVVQEALVSGALEAQAAFCHLDLWRSNILVSDSGKVQVVDWGRAALDDPMRDIALFKAGTLDLLPAEPALFEAMNYAITPHEQVRLKAYLCLTYLHDVYWITHNTPETLAQEYPFKLTRARQVLTQML